jgi:hypothetical protein
MGDKVNDSCISSTNFAQQPESELSPDQRVQSVKQLTIVGTESTCIEMASGDGQQQTAFNRKMTKLVNSRLRIVDESLKNMAEDREKLVAWFSSKLNGLTQYIGENGSGVMYRLDAIDETMVGQNEVRDMLFIEMAGL